MEDDRPQVIRPGRLGQLLALFFLLVVGVPTAAELYIDLRWFTGVEHEDIFRTILSAKILLGVLVGAVSGLCVWGNLALAQRQGRGLPPLFLHDPDGVPRVNLRDIATRAIRPAAILVALLMGLFNHRHWTSWLLYTNRTEFGVADPIFGRDVGFYIFSLPLWDAAASLLMGVLVVSMLGAAAVYTVGGAIAVNESQTRIHGPARTHLSVLAALVLILLATETYLDRFHILYSTLGPMTGASYADVHAKLPALTVKIYIAAAGAVLVLGSINREGFSLIILAAVLYIGAQLGVQVVPSMVHKFSVLPNEYERESTFLKYNIEATRAAYALDAVRERELSAEDTLTAADIRDNRATIENIRLWDHQPLLDTFAQIQEIRTYYDFTSVDNDRYTIGGSLRQTMLSPRELSTQSLPNRTWINERFTFTHGYGLTLGPVNEATPEGLPVLFVQDIPPVSNTAAIKVEQPSIYFGELSNDHVFVRTRNREFHYPSGSGNVETDYDGEAGIRFDSTLMRIALAIRLGSLKLLLSNDIDSDSRVLLYRNITSRVRRVAPFLRLDGDPYMVVRDDGSLSWIYDCYTVSHRYPYAEPSAEGINYIRNSVKAEIDAYDGTVTLYAIDDKDPVLNAWRKVFPNSFVPLSKMPADLRAHLRYPEGIFKIQTQMFTIYHMRRSQLLYNREDQWEVPAITTSDGTKQQMQPYYTVMKLPGEAEAEFIQMLPFTPKRKDNLAAWMVARADGDALGQLVVYRFPKDRLIFGPQQVVNRINQDAEISRQISLWDQRGSRAQFGTLLVIPIEESLIYVRPLYLRSEGGKIPELKRVIVAYEKQIVMEPSLQSAMDAIFGAQPEPSDADEPEQAEAADAEAAAATAEASAAVEDEPEPDDQATPLAARALSHFERAVKAQRAGDWAAYGKQLRRVEELLRQMQPSSP